MRRSRPPAWLLLLAVVLAGVAVWWFAIRDDRPRVLLIGDSLMLQTGPVIETGLGSDVDVRTEAISGTALLSRNQVDWLAKLPDLVDDVDPKVVVMSFNGNCTPPVGLDPAAPVQCDSPEFFQQWEQATEEAVTILESKGAKLFLVLPPPEASDLLAARAKGIGEVYTRVAARHPEIGVIDGYKALADDNGNYQIIANGPTGPEALRAPDSVHFTEAGARRFGFPILIAIKPFVE